MRQHLRDAAAPASDPDFADIDETEIPIYPSAAILAHLASGKQKCVALCVRRAALRRVRPAGPVMTAETLASLLRFDVGGDDRWRCWGVPTETVSTPEIMDRVAAGWSVRSIRVIRSSGRTYTVSAS